MPGAKESHIRSDFLVPFFKLRAALNNPNEGILDGTNIATTVTDHVIPFGKSRSAARNRLWVFGKLVSGGPATINIDVWVHVLSPDVDMWVKWNGDQNQAAQAIATYDNLPGYDAKVLITSSVASVWDIYASHSADMGHP